jgi:hypothetical protein
MPLPVELQPHRLVIGVCQENEEEGEREAEESHVQQKRKNSMSPRQHGTKMPSPHNIHLLGCTSPLVERAEHVAGNKGEEQRKSNSEGAVEKPLENIILISEQF